ncbi:MULTISPECIES: hypothetical protein [unclassified Mesorhizobium]|uniref:hypothetical protein n=1 Tax=unclassified Mesorhizobium TaxID=325217 RepID=UPI000FD8EB0C|nr:MULTISPECIES: hypothetical protein [unclassified Mesorhizobium]TGQ43846.1 hypothetical protein EN859_008775 [Mesorhizobium sp. M00.F.Ca.ET.216.01.1.1]TIS58563.1 MAG: hypothetical protein E5W91_08835 [Mesorhizobium sp.]TIS88933.1 MAG: hypothetical protein E5W89_18265 [Mesorhizobium sp.]TJW13640.1 MAG: hypothetical protein E5W82_13285 [Mesorhizobium sp.]TJW49138.1 MAG: hypothetical protein E5W83_00465 [Mesorhizobium sp.]
MSQTVLKPAVVRPVWFRELFEWLRHAKIALNLPYEPNLSHDNVEDLSDRQLRDIGGERKDIARAMDKELGRLGLLDIGWQRPR